MSVGQYRRIGQGGRRRTLRLVSPRTWTLWTVSRSCLAYVLAIDTAAVGAIALTAALVPINSCHLIWFGALAAASIVHLELTLGIERLRELHTESNTYTNLKSIWTFAGLLVLPPPLVATLIALTYTHMWFRVSRRIVPHRWVFAASNVITASTAGGAILHAAFPDTYPSLPSGWIGFAVVVATAATRWIVNRVLTSFAVVLMYPGTALRGSFGPMADNLIEYGSLALGILVASTLDDPAYLLALIIPVVVVHRGLMLHQFEHAAHRDRSTGLHNAGFWYELAGKALARATHQRTKAGLLLVHIDNHHWISTRYRPDAGDRVLRLVADVLRAALRRDDLAGRLAGENLVLLLTDVDATDLATMA